MRTVKKYTSILIALLMICSFCVVSAGVYAQESSNYEFRDNCDFLQNFRTIDDGLEVFCATMEHFPEAESFNAMMAGIPVDVVSLETANNEPVVYYCLVDVSGSITSPQLICAKQMLEGLCNSLKQGDMMVIATVGEQLRPSGYLRDRDIILKKINEIGTTAEDTNLYRGITDCLEELNTNKDLPTRKALVVFTDGLDDITADIGRTLPEAEKKIDETRIPVYCMIPPSGNKDAGKTMGSLSRRSVGGEDYYLNDRTMTEEQIGKAIATDMKNDKMLTLNLSGFVPKDDEFLLAVEFTDTTGTKYGDSLRIISEVLSIKTVIINPNPTDPPIINYGPVQVQESPWKLWVKVGLAALCILLAVLILVLILKKRKDEKRRKEEEERERMRREAEERARRMNQSPMRGGTEPVHVNQQNNWSAAPIARSNAGARAGRIVRFTAVGNNSFSRDITLQEGKQTIVGRNKKADVVLNESDTRLSGAHFGLMLKDNRLRVWDAGSTNGTSVNGIPVKGNGIEIGSGETISAGSYNYRVQF